MRGTVHENTESYESGIGNLEHLRARVENVALILMVGHGRKEGTESSKFTD